MMTGLLDKPFHSSSCTLVSLSACTKLPKSKPFHLVPCTTPKYHI